MRLTAAVLAAHLLTTIVTLIVIRDFRFPLHGYPHLPFRIFFAVGFSQLMLVAAWLGSAVTKWRQLSWLLVYVVASGNDRVRLAIVTIMPTQAGPQTQWQYQFCSRIIQTGIFAKTGCDRDHYLRGLACLGQRAIWSVAAAP